MPEGTLENKTVLIVEDDNDVYYALATAIRQAGMEAMGASSERLANRALDLAVPDALVVDLDLTGHASGSGQAFIQRLRSSSTSFQNAPIIVHTGLTLSRIEVDELQKNVAAIIFKDRASIDRVVQAVEEALGRRQTRAT